MPGAWEIEFMKTTKTNRGFSITSFKDANGVECNIQISSAMREEALIWFGCDGMGMKGFNPDRTGWHSIPDTEVANKLGFQDVLTNTRMHLTQSQVKLLLPYLNQFVKTWDIELETNRK